MNQIEQIKKELAEISPWPWLSGKCTVYTKRGDLVLHPITQALQQVVAPNITANFIAQSPERIAAMVEYVEATERFHLAPPNDTFSRERFWIARRKLGLE